MMHEQILQALNQRIDEHYAQLSERLHGLDETMQALYAAVLTRMDAHEDYHRRNEHRFGLLRLAERHPLRLATAAFLTGGILLATAPESLRWLLGMAGGLLRQWTH